MIKRLIVIVLAFIRVLRGHGAQESAPCEEGDWVKLHPFFEEWPDGMALYTIPWGIDKYNDRYYIHSSLLLDSATYTSPGMTSEFPIMKFGKRLFTDDSSISHLDNADTLQGLEDGFIEVFPLRFLSERP
jgi:hypothetical protein